MSNEVNNKKQNSSIATWTNIGAVVLFIISISGWFMMAGVYREKVNHLEDYLIRTGTRLHDLENWQQAWPREGELMIDRTQNTEIKDLTRRINLLEERAIQVRILD